MRDSFDRPDSTFHDGRSTALGDKWTVVTGDWWIQDYGTAGYLVTDTAAARIKANFSVPEEVNHYVFAIGVQPIGEETWSRDWEGGERVVIWVNGGAQRFELEYIGMANRGSPTYSWALYLYDGDALKVASIVTRDQLEFSNQNYYPHVGIDSENNVISAGIGSLTGSGGNEDLTIQATITSDVVEIGTKNAQGRIGFYTSIGSGNTPDIVRIDNDDNEKCGWARQEPCEYGYGHQYFLTKDPWPELFDVESGAWTHSNGLLSATDPGVIYWALEHPEGETDLAVTTHFFAPYLSGDDPDQEYHLLLDGGAAYVALRFRRSGTLEAGCRVSWLNTPITIIPWTALSGGLGLRVTFLAGQVQVRVTSVIPEPTPYTGSYSPSSSKVGWENVIGACDISEFSILRAETLAPTYYNDGLTCIGIE